jgi:glycosyltransferase involved in cell wall biosynthesis
MEATPLISVITCTYNAEATLERTLLSVTGQTYPFVEHVIVDGCSADGTFALVQRYVEKGHRQQIRVIREPDEGLYDAMNKGVRSASGDYVVFLNAGDAFHEAETLEKIARCLDWEKGDFRSTAIAYGETDLVDAEGRFIRHRRLKAPGRLTWRSFRQGMLVCHQSFYVRRDLALAIPYNLRYRFSADVDWCIRLLKYVERRRLQVVNTHEILTDYLSEGMTTKNHRASLLERWRVMQHHYGWWQTLAMHLWFAVRAVFLR